jgi:enoyl-CoA hydratase
MLQRGVGPQMARASRLFDMPVDAEVAVRYGRALKVSQDPLGLSTSRSV